ncbi:hypothetical protein CPB84DRAFT_1849154 [Gymnopilus junonius]|uniref:Uncharacterized protein n=1 Tax=Gymnopilus junonius TaxID=109634 RepID=A0A9P5TL95_GYMJU|nr:hypothetical protein CPB84DRAFT_1849154 [Gymnopilus junonius]
MPFWSSGEREDILLYRALTTFLSLLPLLSYIHSDVKVYKDLQDAERSALFLLRLFAIMAVINHKILAIAEKRVGDHLQLQTPQKTDTLCTHVVIGQNTFMPPKLELTSATWRAKLYIITTSFEKFLRRLNNAQLSVPHFQALENVKEVTFNESRLLKVQFGPDITEMTARMLDSQFMKEVVLNMEGLNISLEVPKLLEQALLDKESPVAANSTLQIPEKLQAVKTLDGPLWRPRFQKLPQGPKDWKLRNFHRNVIRATLIGDGLTILVESYALQVHLRNIEALLKENTPTEPITLKNLFAVQDELIVKEDLYTATAQVNPQNAEDFPVWIRYKEWIRLLIIQLDAADRFVDQVLPYTGLSIELIQAPVIDQNMANLNQLQDLLCPKDEGDALANELEMYDPLYGLQEATSEGTSGETSEETSEGTPEEGEPPVAMSGDSVYEKESALIRTCIQAALNWPKVEVDWSEDFKLAIKYWQQNRIKDAVETLTGLASTIGIPEWEIRLNRLVKWILECPTESPVEKLESMSASLVFYAFLQDYSKNPAQFHGTIHAEVCLCSLLEVANNQREQGVLTGEQVKKLKGISRQIGVSRPCCPSCKAFFHSLNADKGEDKYHVSELHNIWSACTLPSWTPPETVKDLNDKHSQDLRSRLLELFSSKDQEDAVLARPSSMASCRLSSGNLKIPTMDEGMDDLKRLTKKDEEDNEYGYEDEDEDEDEDEGESE